MANEKCWCGHSKEDHKDGTGECKECDLQAGYGGNDSCSHYHPKPKNPEPIKTKSLEERVTELETKVKQLLQLNKLF